MITVITFNPAIDRFYKVDKFEKGFVHRANFVNPTPGGKGINVAKVLKKLGNNPTCLGFLGGYNGEYIKEKIKNIGIVDEFTKIDGETRICLNIVDENKTSTEVLEKGPSVTSEDIESFEKKLREVLKDTKILIASGSLIEGLPIDYYKKLGYICRENNVKFILDASSKVLELALDENVYLIKPNNDELKALTQIEINSKEDAINAGKILLKKGVENICISMGKDGMILLNSDSIYNVEIPGIDIVNTVGSGDASIAGFAHGLINGYEIEDCLRLSNACGMSNALYIDTGRVEVDDIKVFTNEMKVSKVNTI